MRQARLAGIALSCLLLAAGFGQAQANEHREVEVNRVNPEGVGESLGTVTLEDTDHGLLLTPDLSGLSPGIHGFHVHENAGCGPEGESAGAEAGGHYDPDETGRHEGPYGDGHLGDLPVLVVDEDGEARLPVLAPRLGLEDLQGRSLMIHEAGDNYADEPKPLGGGGARVACGMIAS
ncbi:superoxide dismutase family protein [Halomonas stenophila]|uniref:Superoxide dismutase [Cu-Zn] n=1 Tax=Halomonas stenophila TaxID=795312 RepID=A0A7W5EV23_9GAMM|nr:superoxide dismutase family protein [Halomonas stenophila]MBB3230855.1 Cu-Zn family superoxide dismutase [Halomonas stenophila]